MPTDFSRVAQYPPQADVAGVFARLLDGIGFRFYWATEELREEDYARAPGQGVNSLGWLGEHVWGLMHWIHTQTGGEASVLPPTHTECRLRTLELIAAIRERIAVMSADRIAALQIAGRPFWYLLNGPLADALTHIGQIAYARRLLGIPAPAAQVFLCEPPVSPASTSGTSR